MERVKEDILFSTLKSNKKKNYGNTLVDIWNCRFVCHW